MNRTFLIFATAAALVVVALIASPTGGAAPLPIAATPAGPAPTPFVATAKDGALQLQAKLASGWAANGGAPNYLSVEIRADELEQTERTPVNLAVVIDRSGSMSGHKLLAAKAAALKLVEQMRDGDRLAIVHYGSDVSSYESQRVSPITRPQMRSFIEAIVDGGGTNISGGLEAGALMLRKHAAEFRASRLILLSDGQPTEGETESGALTAVVRRINASGIAVTALGVGADYDEVLMRHMAEAGGGFTGFIGDASRLAEVFSRELDQAVRAVARDVEVSFLTQPGVSVEEVLGGRAFFYRDGVPTVRLHDFSGGLIARFVVRLSVDLPAGAEPVSLGEVKLRYLDLAGDAKVESSAHFTATVTPDAKLALSHADPEALEHAARAERAKQMQVAAAHFRAGRKEEGLKVLDVGFDNIRKLFGSSANALAGSAEPYRHATDMNEAAKSMQKRSLAEFGDSLDTY